MGMYFEIADDNDWDYVEFVINLPDPISDHAIAAIQAVWGTNSDARRTVMPQPLYSWLCNRPHGTSLIATLKRLIKIGQLTFDRDHPGKPAPRRY